MATHAAELHDLPPYTAMLWSQFQACPPLLYNLFESTVRPGDVAHQSDKVFDVSGSLISHKLSELTVKNIEELHRLTNDLLNMPILFHIKVEHQRTDNYVVVRVRKKWKDEFAVLVNTRHPQIREMITNKLTQAMQYMQEGKNFCLKLDFGPSVRQWYSGIVDSQVTFCDSRSNNDSGHMTLWVTNYSTPMECCTSLLCIFICFPLWLVCGGPCYVTHRKIKCIDEEQEFNDFPVTLLSGVTRTVTIQRQAPVPQAPQYPSAPRNQPMQQYPPQGPMAQPPYNLQGQPQGPYPPVAPPAYPGPPPQYTA
ncbi:uncharacterized protein LOC110452914 [Mizuhopecten yessoensis]|uniref:Uncharacterized protein n=1 Tax=Mizuhopecten yessoensis TaxID=6573 RepID=A0A210QIQ8_MIZYE|nr:uncharacterized protein LOC110452914 [Mizuhopecten yessoensis]OWF48566.1 hypothetical protein KP79_PYT19642 [Mizuhopecten yessoensis]